MLEILQNFLGPVVGAAATLVTIMVDFYTTHQAEISKIVLQIEKDSADGTWSNEDKENEAVTMYLEAKPHFPAKVKLVLMFIPDNWEIDFVRKSIRILCAKRAEMKAKIEAAKPQ